MPRDSHFCRIAPCISCAPIVGGIIDHPVLIVLVQPGFNNPSNRPAGGMYQEPVWVYFDGTTYSADLGWNQADPSHRSNSSTPAPTRNAKTTRTSSPALPSSERVSSPGGSAIRLPCVSLLQVLVPTTDKSPRS